MLIEDARKLGELFIAFAEGKQLQCRWTDGLWHDEREPPNHVDIHYTDLDSWRVKPEE